MPTQEIESTNWGEFCERFLDLHRGALMTVTNIDPAGRSIEVARDMPLTAIQMDSGACNDRIILSFEQPGRRAITHEIIAPIHLKLREEAGGHKSLQIDAENGSTLLVFHSGHIAELLQNLGHG